MTKNDFSKGIAILNGVGLPVKDDWELAVWHKLLEKNGISYNVFMAACLSLAENTVKFWDTDNIPAMLLEIAKEFKQEKTQKLIAQRNEDEESRRKREKQEAIASYDNPEDRLKCIEEFKKMNDEAFKDVSAEGVRKRRAERILSYIEKIM